MVSSAPSARVLIVRPHDHTGRGVSGAILLPTMVNVTETCTAGLDKPITMITTAIPIAVAAAVVIAAQHAPRLADDAGRADRRAQAIVEGLRR